MEIYSLILIKHFGSLGSHSSPRISPTLFEPCFVISRISSSHVKLKSIIPNLAILSVFSKFHHFIILYICWNEEFIVRDNDVFFKKILLYLLYKIFNKNPSNSLVYCKLSFHPSNWKRLAWYIFHFHPLKRYPYLEKIDLEKKKKFQSQTSTSTRGEKFHQPFDDFYFPAVAIIHPKMSEREERERAL